MDTIYSSETYRVIHCATCSLGFGISSDFENRRRSDRAEFYCPAGHRQWFAGKTDKKMIEELRAQIATKEDLLRSTHKELEKRYRLQRAAEGKTRAVKNRIANGVCPCCTRSFQNLARHMHSQHPKYRADES